MEVTQAQKGKSSMLPHLCLPGQNLIRPLVIVGRLEW